MRTTLALDDGLLAEAQRLTGTTEKSALVRQALTALIERESARRLARMGGTEPDRPALGRRATDAGHTFLDHGQATRRYRRTTGSGC